MVKAFTQEAAKVQISLVARHQPPPPCCPSLTPKRSKSCVYGAPGTRSAPHPPWPPRSTPGSVSKGSRWEHRHGSRDWRGLRITVRLPSQNRQAQPEAVPSEGQASQGATERQKKQKNIKHSGIITFDKILNVAWQMWHQSLARELSGTIKEILPSLHAAMV